MSDSTTVYTAEKIITPEPNHSKASALATREYTISEIKQRLRLSVQHRTFREELLVAIYEGDIVIQSSDAFQEGSQKFRLSKTSRRYGT